MNWGAIETVSINLFQKSEAKMQEITKKIKNNHWNSQRVGQSQQKMKYILEKLDFFYLYMRVSEMKTYLKKVKCDMN